MRDDDGGRIDCGGGSDKSSIATAAGSCEICCDEAKRD